MLVKYNDGLAKRDPFNSGLWQGTFFDDLFRDFIPIQSSIQRSYRIEQNDAEMIASFDLPGVKPDDISIDAIDQRVIISYKLRGKERSQEYTIEPEYDASAARAHMEHGVLELRIPRATKTRGKKIAIEVAK